MFQMLCIFFIFSLYFLILYCSDFIFRHDFSAPSKESLHLMILARALEGKKLAQIFINRENPTNLSKAIDILQRKINTYKGFFYLVFS